MILTIGKNRFKNNEYEIIRQASKLNTIVIGGLAKILKHLKNNYLEVNWFI